MCESAYVLLWVVLQTFMQASSTKTQQKTSNKASMLVPRKGKVIHEFPQKACLYVKSTANFFQSFQKKENTQTSHAFLLLYVQSSTVRSYCEQDHTFFTKKKDLPRDQLLHHGPQINCRTTVPSTIDLADLLKALPDRTKSSRQLAARPSFRAQGPTHAV